MRITIEDDFSPDKIARSGQCFRVREFPGGVFRFVTGKHVLYLRQTRSRRKDRHSAGDINPEAIHFEVSCGTAAWRDLWTGYFDLDRNYAALRASIPASDDCLCRAAAYGAGLRILRQDPWEILVTFIISQRKSVPAIRTCVETLCNRYGEEIPRRKRVRSIGDVSNDISGGPSGSSGESCSLLQAAENADAGLRSFPTAERLASVSAEELKACGLGYRVPYVMDAARKVSEGALDLKALYSASSEELLASLKQVSGVGTKVAGCIGLFAYGRTGLAPVDVWIGRVIDCVYGGCDPFAAYGDAAGIMQQYIFHYALAHKKEFASGR